MARPRAPVAPLPSKAPVQVDDPQHGSWGAQSAPDGTTQFYQYTAAGWSEAARAAVPPAVRLALLTALLTPSAGPPRVTDGHGFLVPVEGDRVSRPIPSLVGEAYAYGVVVRTPGGKLRVRVQSSTSLFGGTQGEGGKLTDLTPAWSVLDDPEFERRKIAKETREADEHNAVARADEMALAAVAAHVARGALPVTPENLNQGRIQPGGRITNYWGVSGYTLDLNRGMVRTADPSVAHDVRFVSRLDVRNGQTEFLVCGALPDGSGPDPASPERTTGNEKAWRYMVYEPAAPRERTTGEVHLESPRPFASKAHDDGTADLGGCVLCGRPTPGARHFVELAHGGFIVRPKSANTNDPGYMGLYPIGTECRKKVPDGYVVDGDGNPVRDDAVAPSRPSRSVPLLPQWERVAPGTFLDLATFDVDPSSFAYAYTTPVGTRFVIFATRSGVWYAWHLARHEHGFRKLWALSGSPYHVHRAGDFGHYYPSPQAARAALVADLKKRPWSHKVVIGENARMARRASLRDDPAHAQDEPLPGPDEVWEYPPRGQTRVW